MNPFNWGSPLKCICLPRIFASFCTFENTVKEVENKNELKNKDLINKKYMDLKNENIGSNLNLKL